MSEQEIKSKIKESLKKFIQKSEHWTEEQLSSISNTIEAQADVTAEFLYDIWKEKYMGKENALGEKFDDRIKPEDMVTFLGMRNRPNKF